MSLHPFNVFSRVSTSSSEHQPSRESTSPNVINAPLSYASHASSDDGVAPDGSNVTNHSLDIYKDMEGTLDMGLSMISLVVYYDVSIKIASKGWNRGQRCHPVVIPAIFWHVCAVFVFGWGRQRWWHLSSTFCSCHQTDIQQRKNGNVHLVPPPVRRRDTARYSAPLRGRCKSQVIVIPRWHDGVTWNGFFLRLLQ